MGSNLIHGINPSATQQAELADRIRSSQNQSNIPSSSSANAASSATKNLRLDQLSDMHELNEAVRMLMLDVQHDVVLLKDATLELASLSGKLKDAQSRLDSIPPRPSGDAEAAAAWDSAHANDVAELTSTITKLGTDIQTVLTTMDEIKNRMDDTLEKVEQAQHKVQEKALQSSDTSMGTQKDAARTDAQQDDARKVMVHAHGERVALAQQMLAAGTAVSEISNIMGHKDVLAALTMNAAGRGNIADSVTKKETTGANPALTGNVVNTFGLGPISGG